MLTNEQIDAVIRTEPAAVYELRSSNATAAAVRESLRLIARMIEREAYRRAALVCKEIEDGWYGNDKTAGLAWECVVALEALGREE